jgi:hypothetical protein
MQTLSHLEITTYEFPYTIADKNFSGISRQADFLIDGEPLGTTLQVLRPWSGRTRFEDARQGVNRFVDELLGEEVPQNQFGTGRLVLFGCHCGCDYCGVISCEVLKQGDSLLWRNIGHEDDTSIAQRIDLVVFDFHQYSAAIMDFVRARRRS